MAARQARLDGVSHYEIHRTVQQFLQKLFQVHVVVESFPVQFDDEVCIAVLPRLAPGDGSEERQPPRAARPYRVSVLRDDSQYLFRLGSFSHLVEPALPRVTAPHYINRMQGFCTGNRPAAEGA